jgi:hypothetical protein
MTSRHEAGGLGRVRGWRRSSGCRQRLALRRSSIIVSGPGFAVNISHPAGGIGTRRWLHQVASVATKSDLYMSLISGI